MVIRLWSAEEYFLRTGDGHLVVAARQSYGSATPRVTGFWRMTMIPFVSCRNTQSSIGLMANR